MPIPPRWLYQTLHKHDMVVLFEVWRILGFTTVNQVLQSRSHNRCIYSHLWRHMIMQFKCRSFGVRSRSLPVKQFNVVLRKWHQVSLDLEGIPCLLSSLESEFPLGFRHFLSDEVVKQWSTCHFSQMKGQFTFLNKLNKTGVVLFMPLLVLWTNEQIYLTCCTCYSGDKILIEVSLSRYVSRLNSSYSESLSTCSNWA